MSLLKELEAIGKLAGKAGKEAEIVERLAKVAEEIEKVSKELEEAQKAALAAGKTTEDLAKAIKSQAETIEKLTALQGVLAKSGKTKLADKVAKIVAITSKTIKVGAVAVAGYIGWQAWSKYTQQQQDDAISAARSALPGLSDNEYKKLGQIFNDDAKGNLADFASALGEFGDKYKITSDKDAEAHINDWKTFAPKWANDKKIENAKPAPQRFVDSALNTLSGLLDPKNFGAGSLLVGGALAALGAWLGGAWLAIPFMLLGGLFGQKILPIDIPAPAATPAVAAQNTGGAAVNAPAAQPQPEVTVPTGLPPVAAQMKPVPGTSPASAAPNR